MQQTGQRSRRVHNHHASLQDRRNDPSKAKDDATGITGQHTGGISLSGSIRGNEAFSVTGPLLGASAGVGQCSPAGGGSHGARRGAGGLDLGAVGRDLGSDGGSAGVVRAVVEASWRRTSDVSRVEYQRGDLEETYVAMAS